MYLVDFVFDGLKLSDFGCMVGSAVTDNSQSINMGSVIDLETTVNHGTYTSEIVNATYPDVYTVIFDIFKNPCGHGMGDVFEDKEVTWFMRWLNRKEYKKFVPIYDNPKDYYRLFFMGTFTECKAINIQGQVYGFTLTFVSNSPFAYLDYKPNTYNVVNSDQQFVIVNSSGQNVTKNGGIFMLYDESEELGAVYPKSFYIQVTTAGDLIIYNSMDSNERYTEIKNCAANEIIIMDCVHKIITAKRGTEDHPGLYNDFNYVYPRLVNEFSERMNKFYVTLDSTVTIEYNPIRKVGVIA